MNTLIMQAVKNIYTIRISLVKQSEFGNRGINTNSVLKEDQYQLNTFMVM